MQLLIPSRNQSIIHIMLAITYHRQTASYFSSIYIPVLNEIAREKISLVRRNEPTATTSTGMHQSWAEISSRTSNPGRFLCPVDNFLGEYLKCTGSERRSPFRLNSCKIYHEGSASRERNLVALRQEFFHIPLQIIHELPLLASE